MAKTIIQFAYRDMQLQEDISSTLDCRDMNNPWRYGVADSVLRDRVRQDPKFEVMVANGVALLGTYDTIQVGCQYGKHRSVAIADEIAKRTGATVKRHKHV